MKYTSSISAMQEPKTDSGAELGMQLMGGGGWESPQGLEHLEEE